jgi:hypothetical protein
MIDDTTPISHCADAIPIVESGKYEVSFSDFVFLSKLKLQFPELLLPNSEKERQPLSWVQHTSNGGRTHS